MGTDKEEINPSIINENIETRFLMCRRPGQCINAPRDISIHRKEVFIQISEENKKATSISMGVDLNNILKNKK